MSAASARPRAGGPAFFRDSFRPFYLGGTLFAALAAPLWLAVWFGKAPGPSLPALLWHMHEMVFGFAAAMIMGFLFTAARNWTGRPLPVGTPLAALFALWAAARVGMFVGYGRTTAVLDSLPLLIVGLTLAARFVRARSWTNLPLAVVVLGLATANLVFHAAMLGWTVLPAGQAVEFGLLLVVMVEMIVGGRVVPGFTASGLPGVRQLRPRWLHRLAIALTALAVCADAARLPPPWQAGSALLAGVAVLGQALGWNPWATRRTPLLWILHLSYLWIPVGLLLLGASAIGAVPRSAAIHALTVGSMGGLILGMATRTALGHSGRPVRAGRAETLAFALLTTAALSRVAAALTPTIAPALAQDWYAPALTVSAAAWGAGFLLYAIAYTPILLGLQPRMAARPS